MRQYFKTNRLKHPFGSEKDKSNSTFGKSILAASLCLAMAPVAFATEVFINEIHYDNASSDKNEGVEIAGPAGTDLSDWTLIFYNGNDKKSYKSVGLTGVLPNQQDSFGTLSFNVSGIQNGSPDAIALVDASGAVLQFLSYEGSFVAIDGPAKDLTSIDIGVSETSSTPVGHSLQLAGTGSKYDDFSWQSDSANTSGAVNNDQTFGNGGLGDDVAPTVIATTPGDQTGVVALNSNINISFSESVNVTGEWFSINCSISGAHSATFDSGPQHYSLNSEVNFDYNEICTVNVVGDLVNDVDDNDPPGLDTMADDVSFSFSTAVNSPIVINEVDADTLGTDTLEFIELYDGGIGNTSLDGLTVVLYNGSDDKSSGSAISLNGFTTNSEGFFVLGHAAVSPTPSLIPANFTLQNGADAVAIHAGDVTDYPNDTPVSGFSLVDAIVYDTNDSDAEKLLAVLTPSQKQINEHGAGNKDSHSNSRVPDGGQAVVTSSYLQQMATPGYSNVAVVEIFEIQGSGLVSPFKDQYVTTKGNIVTAVGPKGFFIQTPVLKTDYDAATSDGLYVYTGKTPSTTVGDEVNITGSVVEYKKLTEYAYGSQVSIISSGNVVPPVVKFDENTPSPEQPTENEMERYEGMIVTFEGTVTGASDKFSVASVVARSNRTFREPGIAYPGETDLPVWDGNPEIFEIDTDVFGGPKLSLFANQAVTVTGPLGSSYYSKYQVWPTSITAGAEPALLGQVRHKADGEMTVGSLNMYRPSEIAKDYLARLSKISQFVRNEMHSPDILAVSEIGTLEVLKTIAEQIHSDDGSVNYTSYLVEGNDIGGIDVGFLVRSTVEMDEITQYGKDINFVYGTYDRPLNDRPPLLFKGRVIADGSNFPIQVLVVHNRSLSNVDSSERVRLKRLAQAQFVANIVQDIQSVDPDVNLVVTGDFNAYQFSDGYVDVLGQITGTSTEEGNMHWEPSPVYPVITNQVNNIPAEEQYSFVFRGSAQVLDHALTTANLDSLVTEFQYARGNSDAPSDLVNQDHTAMRASDHDGIVLFIMKDSDNDSITDDLDLCPNTAAGASVDAKGCTDVQEAHLLCATPTGGLGKFQDEYEEDGKLVKIDYESSIKYKIEVKDADSGNDRYKCDRDGDKLQFEKKDEKGNVTYKYDGPFLD